MPRHVPKIRGDLIYEADPNDEDSCFVKDPVRGDFFRYNTLQVAMMQALDGKRTADDVAALLTEQYEVEVPIAAIERFTDRLEKAYLLDVTSYTVDDVATRKKIRAYLRKRKLNLRIKARDATSPEATMFSAATRQLHDGDPCLAASYLEAVLEINPDNERARRVAQAIQEAFFETKIVAPAGLQMWKIWNPDRFLTWLDKKVGKAIFSPLGMIALFLFVLSAIPAVIEVMTRPDAFDGLTLTSTGPALAVLMIQLFIHELGHGLACKHYGGRVDDIGALLLYYVFPGAYCDVSESYMFPEKRHRVIVQLAGITADLGVQAATWHMLALTNTSFPGWGAMLIINLYGLYSTLQNLIPLVKLDGYYALAEIINIPNLREKSFDYLSRRLNWLVLGIGDPNEPKPPDRERRIFLWYAILAGIFTPMEIYFGFINFLIPLAMDTLGVVGLIFATFYIITLVAKVVLRPLFHFSIHIFRNRAVVFTRMRMLSFAAVASVLAVLLSFDWPLHVQGEMEIEPLNRASIRAQEAGFVSSVAVREGDVVKAGQVLAVLRSDDVVRDRAQIEASLASAKAELAMLKRGATAEELAKARAHTRLEEVRSSVQRSRFSDTRRLEALQVATKESTLRAAASASQATGEARVSRHEEAEVRAGARKEEIVAEEANVRRLEAMLEAAVVRQGRLEIKSPINGVVVTRRVEQQFGRHLAIGDEVMEVHDTSHWRIRITPGASESLRGVHAGQRVEAKAFGDSTHVVTAKLDEVLSSPLPDEKVTLYASTDGRADWRSGMTGEVRILGPSRTIAYRIIALPVIRLIDFDLWRIR